MNNELKKLAQQAGTPEQVLNELWFGLFCMKFADVILANAEHEMNKIKDRIHDYEQKS
jgi:hypothetical protein